MTERSICGTSVLIDHLSTDICTKFGVKSELQSWKATEIGDGKGFISVIAKVEFKWDGERERQQLPKSAIVKIPTAKKFGVLAADGQKEMMDSMKDNICSIHNTECSVYELFSAMKRPPCKLPTLFGLRKLADAEAFARNEPVYIMMEDLTGPCTHWQTVTSEKLNRQQTEQVVLELARLNAWSIACPDQVKAVIPNDNSKQLIGYGKGLPKQHSDFKERLKQQIWIDILGDAAIQRAVSYPKAKVNEMFNSTQDEFVMDLDDMKAMWSTKQHAFGVPTVLKHGDIHVSNILVHKHNGQPTGHVHCLLDWQMVRFGNLASDLTRLLNWTTHFSNRSVQSRNHFLDVYYAEFETSYSEGAPGKNMPFTREQLGHLFWATSVHFNKSFVFSILPMFLQSLEMDKMVVENKEMAIRDMIVDMSRLYKDTSMISDEILKK